MRPTHARRLVVAAAFLAVPVTGCSHESVPSAASAPSASSSAAAQCRQQWRDVAQGVVGLDQDSRPSSLAERWTSVLATIDYYENAPASAATTEGCQRTIDAQVEAITALRGFTDRIRPYDMAFQRDSVRSGVEQYLADPLPTPQASASPGASKKATRAPAPPSKAAVQAAMVVLEARADEANTALQPGWAQLSSLELTDTEAVASALQDLAFLGQDSADWRACRAALQVITRALALQS